MVRRRLRRRARDESYRCGLSLQVRREAAQQAAADRRAARIGFVSLVNWLSRRSRLSAGTVKPPMWESVLNSRKKCIQSSLAFVGTFSVVHFAVCAFIVFRDLALNWGQPIDGHGLFSFIVFTLFGPIVAVEVALGYLPLAALLAFIRRSSLRVYLLSAGCTAIFCYVVVAVIESPFGFSLRRQFSLLAWSYDLGIPLAPMLLGGVSVVLIMLPMTVVIGALLEREVVA